MKVLVCDDLPEGSSEFEDAIGEAAQPEVEIDRLFGGDLREQLNALIAGANDALQEGEGALELPKTKFDGADLVFLDNNLAHLGIAGARLTAESIAGYIRSFSSASYIVSINKNPDVDFDLRYLIGDYATRTDLALNTRHLSNPALWTRGRADAENGFLPWYWPKLRSAGAVRQTQIEFVEANLDQSVSEALGFAAEDFNFLSRQARSLLSQAEETRDGEFDQREPRGTTATFREVFLASGRSLPNQEERQILHGKLKYGVDGVSTIIARAVTADVDLWFRREVLGPQEVVVDIPHLLMRMPFLLGRKAGEIDHWNNAADAAANDPPFGLDEALFDAHLAQALLGQSIWSISPCFWWPKLRNNDDLGVLLSGGDGTTWADVVFCEDRSAFFPPDPGNEDSPPIEFVAQFEGSWSRRYVAMIDGVGYVPKTRFAQ